MVSVLPGRPLREATEVGGLVGRLLKEAEPHQTRTSIIMEYGAVLRTKSTVGGGNQKAVLVLWSLVAHGRNGQVKEAFASAVETAG